MALTVCAGSAGATLGKSGYAAGQCATTRLGCLLRNQGRADEGWEVLSEVYGRFTKDFDTPDLKRAAALLIRLS